MWATIVVVPSGVGGGAGPLHLLGEGHHLHRVPALAAQLLGPARRQPALVHPGPVELPVVADAGAVHPLPDLVGQGLVEEGAHLGPEGVAAIAQTEVHRYTPIPSRQASALA